jgi:opacity protein-like surface antigen
MKKVLFVIVLVGVVFVFAGLSYAESYVSGYIGAAIPHDSDASDNTGIGGSGEVEFDAGVAVGGKIGYWFTEQNIPSFGLEIDFNGHFPDTDKLDVFGIGLDLDADVDVYSITVNALLRYPEGGLRPYAGVGLGWFFADIDDGTILGLPFKGDDDSVFGWQLLTGVDLFINPNVSVFAEYKYSQADFEFGGGIGVDVDYEVSQIYGGISLHF